MTSKRHNCLKMCKHSICIISIILNSLLAALELYSNKPYTFSALWQSAVTCRVFNAAPKTTAWSVSHVNFLVNLFSGLHTLWKNLLINDHDAITVKTWNKHNICIDLHWLNRQAWLKWAFGPAIPFWISESLGAGSGSRQQIIRWGLAPSCN